MARTSRLDGRVARRGSLTPFGGATMVSAKSAKSDVDTADDADPSDEEGDSSDPDRLRAGYMIKEPLKGNVLSQAKRRFFVLTPDAIEWHDNDEYGSIPKGYLRLRGAQVYRRGLHNEELALTSAGDELVMRLGPDNDDADLDKWEAAIQRQMRALGGAEPQNERLTAVAPRLRTSSSDGDLPSSLSTKSSEDDVDLSTLHPDILKQVGLRAPAERQAARRGSLNPFNGKGGVEVLGAKGVGVVTPDEVSSRSGETSMRSGDLPSVIKQSSPREAAVITKPGGRRGSLMLRPSTSEVARKSVAGDVARKSVARRCSLTPWFSSPTDPRASTASAK
eukprot:3175448-Prymnesium_polylepis.1